MDFYLVWKSYQYVHHGSAWLKHESKHSYSELLLSLMQNLHTHTGRLKKEKRNTYQLLLQSTQTNVHAFLLWHLVLNREKHAKCHATCRIVTEVFALQQQRGETRRQVCEILPSCDAKRVRRRVTKSACLRPCVRPSIQGELSVASPILSQPRGRGIVFIWVTTREKKVIPLCVIGYVRRGFICQRQIFAGNYSL